MVVFILNYLQFGRFFLTNKITKELYPVARAASVTPVPRQWYTTESSLSQVSVSDFAERAPWDKLDETSARLVQEIRALGRRGNVNLVIGIITIFIGVCLLGFVVFWESDVDPSDHWRYAFHFMVRLSIALFVEVFAYFFLRLYKNGLEDIKYYQNEISNVQSKQAAMLLTIKLNDKVLSKLVIDALVKTERNFLLKKGETTLSLERERLDKNELLEFVKDTIGIARKNPKVTGSS
jgi:hypothetical protein